MGILIEFNTSQAAKSQCYSYEAALLLQLKSGSAAASRQVERKVGLSGSKRRGKKINRCVNFFIWFFFYLVVFLSSGFCGHEKQLGQHRWNDCYHALLKETRRRTPSPSPPYFLLMVLPACRLTLVPSLSSSPARKKCAYWTLIIHFSRMKRLTEISFWDTSGIHCIYMICFLPQCLINRNI